MVMKSYGEDIPPRVEKFEDLHAREVWLKNQIIDEFRAVFNIACVFADELKRVDPENRFVKIAQLEGMLGRFIDCPETESNRKTTIESTQENVEKLIQITHEETPEQAENTKQSSVE